MTLQGNDDKLPEEIVESNFEIEADVIASIVRGRDTNGLITHRGMEGIATKISSSLEDGILSSDAPLRQKVYGFNIYTEKPLKGFWTFVWEALQDLTLIILMISAVVSLGIGVATQGWTKGVYDGIGILLCIFLVVMVSAVSNFNQSLQFRDLDREKKKIYVQVTRDGCRNKILISDLVVGDIIHLSIGDIVPADGIFISGYNLLLDESSLSGESEPVYVDNGNPFLLSGTKVQDGSAKMLVTAVGMRTEWGNLMETVSQEGDDETPLQVKLNGIAKLMGKLGLGFAGLTFFAFVTRFLVDKGIHHELRQWSSKDAMKLLNYFATAVIVVVIAVPEGLPLAVMLSLAFAMKKLMKAKTLVRQLSACETMGSATCICTDKTGTLTTNHMVVDKIWVSGLNKEMKANDLKSGIISECVLSTLLQATLLNTGAEVARDRDGNDSIIGKPTASALVKVGLLLGGDFEDIHQKFKVENVEPFNSVRKRMSVIVGLPGGGFRAFCNGAPEIVLGMCSRILDCNGYSVDLSEEQREKVACVIDGFASKTLRTICLAFRDMDDDWDITTIPQEEYTLIAVVGMKDPVRPEVKDAVETCLAAGITVRMVTGDNINTAKAIAKECGILTEGGLAIEGSELRNKTLEEMKEMLPRIQVMARSLPSDKHTLVSNLRKLGEVVAVTGDGTNDAPALHESDIGLAMGIAGTEVAKENADVIILDDNFATIVSIAKWGRAVYVNIQRFVQFQLTINIVALMINLVSACIAGIPPLKIVQWLWINLIQDTFAALALATEPPTDAVMKRPPHGRDASLISKAMWRNIVGQSAYQFSVLAVVIFDGKRLLKLNDSDNSDAVLNTFAFNSFVFCQVFNEINCRDTDKINVFRGMFGNWMFIGILVVTVTLQAIIVEFLGTFASTVPLNWQLWSLSILIGAASMPLDTLLKCIPVVKTDCHNDCYGFSRNGAEQV
ncbi:calcium-transporting ATPase 4, plasma membrane-type-like isoform X2 [Silene latifolia]|uniref:calcium-transporting ATPase 4, plasma membrane-type-like isoform X2 n=1 Tax=Silene latifolia TaxID=37657 RepID=UPI003D777952